MNNRLSAAVVVAVITCSSSCMIGPAYHRPSAPAAPAFKEEPPAGWKQAQPADGAVRGKWWTVYKDPRLDALEEQVTISNQNVLAAEAFFREAKAAVSVARAGLFPGLSSAPSVVNSRAQTTYTIPVTFAYQIDVWGSIRRGIAANSALAQASAAQLESVRLVYQAELATDYFELQGLDATVRLFSATVKSYEGTVALTQNRYDGGIATLGDVALAKTQLETARAQLADLGIQRAQFEHAVAVLTGKPPSALSIPDGTVQSPPPLFLAGIPSAMLERRPDIAIAERQVAAANEQIGIAMAALYPALTLSASAGSQASAVLDLLTWPSRFWSVGPQLAGTLFDAGRHRAQIRMSQAAYDAVVANYRQTVLTSFQQVEDNLAQLRILSEEGVIVDRAVQASQRSLQISTDQYRGGIANYLQVITAQTSALQNQRSAVEIMTRRLVASVGLIEALGGGWDTTQLPATKTLR